MVSLAVWLFAGLQERQVSQFIEEKQQTILAKGKGKIQEEILIRPMLWLPYLQMMQVMS